MSVKPDYGPRLMPGSWSEENPFTEEATEAQRKIYTDRLKGHSFLAASIHEGLVSDPPKLKLPWWKRMMGRKTR